jgi:hypothetical protein
MYSENSQSISVTAPIYICHTAIENLSDPIGYLLDFTNPYYPAIYKSLEARQPKYIYIGLPKSAMVCIPEGGIP